MVPLSVTLFANKHDYAIITTSGDKKRLRLDYKRELVVLKWTDRNLDEAMLKNIWFQISTIIYKSSNHYSCVGHTFQQPFCVRKRLHL